MRIKLDRENLGNRLCAIIFFTALSFPAYAFSHSLNDLKTFVGFKLNGKYTEVNKSWGQGYFSQHGDAGNSQSRLLYRMGNILISFEGGEMSGKDGYFTFRLKNGADKNIPIAPVNGSLEIAGFKLGMKKKEFLENLKDVSSDMKNYHLKKKLNTTNEVYRWFERAEGKGCRGYLTLDAKFRNGKLDEIEIHQLTSS